MLAFLVRLSTRKVSSGQLVGKSYSSFKWKPCDPRTLDPSERSVVALADPLSRRLSSILSNIPELARSALSSILWQREPDPSDLDSSPASIGIPGSRRCERSRGEGNGPRVTFPISRLYATRERWSASSAESTDALIYVDSIVSQVQRHFRPRQKVKKICNIATWRTFWLFW